MKVTMKDVAAKAGCSQAAVSKALCNAPDISESRRMEIRKIASQLGYRPNPLVSALMASRGDKAGAASCNAVLALISNWPTLDRSETPWWNYLNVKEQMRGIFDEARESGFGIEEFSLAEDGLSPVRLHKILSTRRMQGIIALPALDYTAFLQLPLEEYCVAAIGAREPIQHIPHTTTNRFDNMIMALENLERRGYRRPGLVLNRLAERMTHLQYHGAYMAYADSHRNIKRLPVHLLQASNPSTSLVHWIKIGKPDVIIGNIQSLRLIREEGYRVPDDFAFCLIDRTPSDKGVAGFDSNQHEVGVAAVNLVVARLYRNSYGPPRYPRSTLVNGIWIDDDSAPSRNPS